MEVRTLKGGATGRALVGGLGFGVEVLDGGRYGRQNLLLLHGDDGAPTLSFAGDGVVRCIAGTRKALRFEALELVSPGAGDSVTLRILREPVAGWVDVDPTGKPRWRWMARNSIRVVAGAWGNLLDTSAGLTPAPDRYAVGTEDHDVAVHWAGLVLGTESFEVWCFAQVLPGTNVWQACQRWRSKNYSVLPGTPSVGLIGAHSVDFTTGADTDDHSTVGSAVLAPFPASAELRLELYNPTLDKCDAVYVIAAHG